MANPHDVTGTDRALRRLVGLVVVLAVLLLIAAVCSVLLIPNPNVILINVAATVALVTFCGVTSARIRIRSSHLGVTWSDTAALIAMVTLRPDWALLCVAVGIIATKLIQRPQLMKAAFAVGKEIVTAAMMGVVISGFGAVSLQPSRVLPLFLAFFAAYAVDEFLTLSVVARATDTKFRDRFQSDLDLRWGSAVVRFAIGLLALEVLLREPRLLLAIPPLVLSLHLTHRGRLRARTERLAWQRLAEATDALNVVQMEAVLSTAVMKGADLFSADQIEVEVWIDGHELLARGNGEGVSYLGQPDRHAYPETTTIIPLVEDAAADRVGELRLLFNSPVSLSEREHFTLRAFSGALCTAIRNAASYTQLAELADQHAHDAAHDPLTGLPNRRRLQDEGALALENRDRKRGMTALLLLDLNHFKDVNDALGHAAGDQVLIAVARRLEAAAGPEALVTRLGGDEFAILYRALPAPALALHRATALLAVLREPVEVDGMPLTISASGGVAMAPSRGGFVELLRRADIAMYQAKRTGRPVTAYAADRDTADRTRLVVGGMLPRAVAEKEFTLEFQPIVDLETGEPISAEALARWQQPGHGKVDPRSFLEPIERSGLLTAFTDAVLDQALAGAARWQEAGYPCPVAVNISPRSLLDRRLPALVAARLDDYGLTGESLVLELTESNRLSGLDIVDKVLAELRELGCMLALDDFGTGFSSLSVLPRVPVQELKIDRSFVSQMEHTPRALAVVKSTVELARQLDLLVVAEGVERESQRKMLWELGCKAGQGHLFAKPMPLAEIMKLARSGKPLRFAEPLHPPGSVLHLPQQRRPGLSAVGPATAAEPDDAPGDEAAQEEQQRGRVQDSGA